jgi:hypothetical protein
LDTKLKDVLSGGLSQHYVTGNPDQAGDQNEAVPYIHSSNNKYLL